MELEWAGDKLTVSQGDEISSSRVTALIRSCQMITDYFNMILGPREISTSLNFYVFRLTDLNGDDGSRRRPYFGSTLLPDDSVPIRLTSVYGLPHLLRLFNCFAAKLANLPADLGNILALKVMSSDFVSFVEENREKYFSVRRDYEAQE
ncbi:unnamed protein product [Cylicocyclus nassatus]|uniref:MRG domain-containing protein n=1 Tax=Cylicocyclus nassatus TaxID=53992 RepID=A0AA36DPY9_CYLNA|nr:unnamed protein product [Cylicocyclus nassatus]